MALFDDLRKQGTFGVLVSRLCPMTRAHQTLIQLLLDAFGEKYIVFLGSSNAKISIPQFFSHRERVGFARIVFPNLRVIGIPDYGNDVEWMGALDDYLDVVGARGEKVVFVAGSFEDVAYFHEIGRSVFTVNRFSGEHTIPISGSQVRSALIERQPLDALVDTRLVSPVRDLFDKKWPEFLKLRA